MAPSFLPCGVGPEAPSGINRFQENLRENNKGTSFRKILKDNTQGKQIEHLYFFSFFTRRKVHKCRSTRGGRPYIYIYIYIYIYTIFRICYFFIFFVLFRFVLLVIWFFVSLIFLFEQFAWRSVLCMPGAKPDLAAVLSRKSHRLFLKKNDFSRRTHVFSIINRCVLDFFLENTFF